MFTNKNDKFVKLENDKFKKNKSDKINFGKIEFVKTKKPLSLDVFDKTPLSNLLTLNAEELFDIQEKARLEFEKASYRKKWIDGIIELKYKSTIEKSYKKALEYFNNEPLQEMDKYNSELLTTYINDGKSIVKVEFYRSKQQDKSKGYSQVSKRFSLVETNNIGNKN